MEKRESTQLLLIVYIIHIIATIRMLLRISLSGFYLKLPSVST